MGDQSNEERIEELLIEARKIISPEDVDWECKDGNIVQRVQQALDNYRILDGSVDDAPAATSGPSAAAAATSGPSAAAGGGGGGASAAAWSAAAGGGGGGASAAADVWSSDDGWSSHGGAAAATSGRSAAAAAAAGYDSPIGSFFGDDDVNDFFRSLDNMEGMEDIVPRPVASETTMAYVNRRCTDDINEEGGSGGDYRNLCALYPDPDVPSKNPVDGWNSVFRRTGRKISIQPRDDEILLIDPETEQMLQRQSGDVYDSVLMNGDDELSRRFPESSHSLPRGFLAGQPLPQKGENCITKIVLKKVDKKGFGVFAKKDLYEGDQIRIPIIPDEQHPPAHDVINDGTKKGIFIDHYSFSQYDTKRIEKFHLYPDLPDFEENTIVLNGFKVTDEVTSIEMDTIMRSNSQYLVKYMFNTTDEEFVANSIIPDEKNGKKCVYCKKNDGAEPLPDAGAAAASGAPPVASPMKDGYGPFILSDGSNICLTCAQQYNKEPEYVLCIRCMTNDISSWWSYELVGEKRTYTRVAGRLGIAKFLDTIVLVDIPHDDLQQKKPAELIQDFGDMVDRKWMRKLTDKYKKQTFGQFNYGQNVDFRFHYGSEGEECMIFEVQKRIEQGEELLISYNYDKRVKA